MNGQGGSQVLNLQERLKKTKKQKQSLALYWSRKAKVGSLEGNGPCNMCCSESENQAYGEKIADLENKLLEAEEKLKEMDNLDVIATKFDKKTFNGKIRQCVYFCLLRQVPTEHTGEVISHIIHTMTGQTLHSVPSHTSIKRMAREMGVLSDIQAGSALHKEANSTLSWDATAIDGCHINEVHVSVEEGSFTLGVSEIASGRTTDYHVNLTDTIGDVVEAYSDCMGLDANTVREEVYDNICNTLTDRVVLDHCVVTQLSNTFGHPLTEINFNDHPLDGLANKARGVLKERDRELNLTGKTFGRESVAVNVI